jgi:orotidine-5'-phosphate decarboxylase
MGSDSVLPFLAYKDKWTILLGLTSNAGAADFELQQAGEERLYEKVLRTASQWGNADQLMFVIGATHPEEFKNIRALAPDYFFLVPGVGAQGGDLDQVSENGWNSQCGLIVNSTRNIIYAGKGEDFAEKARESAFESTKGMVKFVKRLAAV